MSTIKVAYASSATIFGSTDLDSLASDVNLLAGRESNVIDNSTNLYVDALLAGRFKANASAPTAGTIAIFVGSILENTGPSYPDVFDGTGSAETVTVTSIRNAILRCAATLVTDTTTNRVYEFAPISVASLFGGVMPQKWFVFVSHSMVTALNATANNGGQCWYTGINYTVA